MTDDQINEACELAEREVKKILSDLESKIGSFGFYINPDDFTVTILLKPDSQ